MRPQTKKQLTRLAIGLAVAAYLLAITAVVTSSDVLGNLAGIHAVAFVGVVSSLVWDDG